MTRRTTGSPMPRRTLRALAAAALALGIAALAPLPAIAAPDDIVVTVPERTDGPSTGGTTVANAQLRWGLSRETGAGAYAGGCNFLSAGVSGDSGGPVAWTAGNGLNRLYSAEDGSVRIEKPTASGEWTRASWDTRCTDAAGRAVSVASVDSTTGNQVVIDGGNGTVRADGSVEIRWRGSFTVVFYGGMTYWSVSDPVLVVDAGGNGQLTGTASGYGADMNDVSKWDPIAPRPIVLADVRNADVAGRGGFAVVPEYLGVTVNNAGQVGRTTANAAYWGAFPQSFVDFHRLTGQQGYWVTSGGARDAAKPATTLFVSYDAAAPVATPPPAAGGADEAVATPSNPIRRAPAASIAPVNAASVAALPSIVSTNTPITSIPQREGLIPGAIAAMSPLVTPLLGSAAALGVSIIAVLTMMQAFPWQRPLP